jgi:hypothetical protein
MSIANVMTAARVLSSVTGRKWTIVVDVVGRAVLARPGSYNDCRTLRPLLDTAHVITPINECGRAWSLRVECDHQHVRQVLGVNSVIRAKRGTAHWKIEAKRVHMHKRFPRRQYALREQVESVFSTIQRTCCRRARPASDQFHKDVNGAG